MEMTVVMSAEDNVATCLTDLKAGASANVLFAGKPVTITIRDDIPFGHKVALAEIETSGDVIKYAEVIGVASRPISVGEHVHVHNVESVRARGDKTIGEQS